jgi:ankyrin repeat protein
VRREHLFWQAIIDLPHGERQLTRLQVVALEGDAPRVRDLCRWRADVEAADMAGRTPLVLAAAAGKVDAVRELAAAGANVDAVSVNLTPLIVAAVYGHTDVVTALVASGADVGAGTKNGTTAWTAAGLYAPETREAVLRALSGGRTPDIEILELVESPGDGLVRAVELGMFAAGFEGLLRP